MKPKLFTEFFIRLGEGKVTFIMKLEAWAAKQPSFISLLFLEIIIPVLKKWLIEAKVRQTMAHVDRQAEDIVEAWEAEEEDGSDYTVTIIEDPDSPFGIAELRATSNFMETKVYKE